jgi:hypothetical protein
VAVVAVVGEDRPDMAVEIDLIDLIDAGLSGFHGIGERWRRGEHGGAHAGDCGS